MPSPSARMYAIRLMLSMLSKDLEVLQVHHKFTCCCFVLYHHHHLLYLIIITITTTTNYQYSTSSISLCCLDHPPSPFFDAPHLTWPGPSRKGYKMTIQTTHRRWKKQLICSYDNDTNGDTYNTHHDTDTVTIIIMMMMMVVLMLLMMILIVIIIYFIYYYQFHHYHYHYY